MSFLYLECLLLKFGDQTQVPKSFHTCSGRQLSSWYRGSMDLNRITLLHFLSLVLEILSYRATLCPGTITIQWVSKLTHQSSITHHNMMMMFFSFPLFVICLQDSVFVHRCLRDYCRISLYSIHLYVQGYEVCLFWFLIVSYSLI